ncbi:MAG: hypothetical protein FJ368_01905 [Pelagibacterales bacterium]|nr:hypothetical protein [Pelagibacterales bacterium]
MLKTLWFLFIAFLISVSFAWILESNGEVLITWLGYEIRTNVLIAILLTSLATLFICAVSYLAARVLTIGFPSVFKLLFKKTHVRKLEDLIKKHRKGFDELSELLMAIELKDKKASESLYKSSSKLIKTQKLNAFLLGKIELENKSYEKAEKLFASIENSKYSKILVLKSKFKSSLDKKDDLSAIAYAQQILSVKKDNIEIAQELFILYKKQGLWKEAKSLIKEYGQDKFLNDLQKRDAAVINTAIAFEHYRNKEFWSAIKYGNLALKAEENFLPAIEIILKCWIKKGFIFKTKWMIKKLWEKNPHIVLAEIFDLTNHKISADKRISEMKRLVSKNKDSYLSKLAIGLSAFRVKKFNIANEFLRLSLLSEKTHRGYKLLACTQKYLKNNIEAEQNLHKAAMIQDDLHYSCSSCHISTSQWSARCKSCDSYDSLEWLL